MKQIFEQVQCDKCLSRLSNIFCSLTDKEAKNLSVEKSCNYYKKGQPIFFEGNKPLGLYCINKGKVKVYQTGDTGKEQILRLAKDGDILGYRALISGEPYSASAASMDDSTICLIPRETFDEVLNKNSMISTDLLKLLSHDLKEAEHRITELAQRPVRERMAETLLMLREFYGFDTDKKTINALLSRDDIANFAGTATETAIRILSEFREEKIIKLKGKKISILDQKKLVKAANVYD